LCGMLMWINSGGGFKLCQTIGRQHRHSVALWSA
jgi:hypothetical protein